MKNKLHSMVFITVMSLLLAACNPSLDADINLGKETLERIDAVNETLKSGIEIGPETRDTIDEFNKTLRQGVKAGLDEQTLQKLDDLLRIIEDGVGLTIYVDVKTLQTVQNLTDVIENAPDQWKMTLEDIIKSFENAAGTTSKQIAEDLKKVIDKAEADATELVGDIGIEFRCNVDFLKKRGEETIDKYLGRTMVDHLKSIISTIMGKHYINTVISPNPWVCQILPDSIELIKTGDQITTGENLITIKGFNLQNLTPSIDVLDENNSIVEAIHLPLLIGTSSYQIQLNLQGIDFKAAPVRSKISFHWPNVNDVSEIPLIFPIIKPTAEFAASPKEGELPLEIFFENQSQDATAWKWDFGDGDTSLQQNPIHVYTRQGSFSVTLLAINAQGEDELTKQNLIVVSEPEPRPVADFEVDVDTGIVPLTVNFKDRSEGNHLSWHWDFGDGKTEVIQNPTHKYETTGTFLVTLEVTDAQGFSSISRPHNITVSELPPPPEVYKWDAFSVYHYSYWGGKYLTSLSTDIYDCGVFGFRAHGASTSWILDNFMQNEFLQVYAKENEVEGLWEVITRPSLIAVLGRPPVMWDIDLICIKKENEGAYIKMTLPGQGEWAETEEELSLDIKYDPIDYICGIVGFRFQNTMPESDENGNLLNLDKPLERILEIYPTFDEGGPWKIKGSILLDHSAEIKWQVDVLCLKRDNRYIYDFGDENPDNMDIEPYHLDFGVSTYPTGISQSDGTTSFKSLTCGVTGFSVTQREKNLYKSEIYEAWEGYHTNGEFPCTSYDCTIIESRMVLSSDNLWRNYWNVSSQITWGEMLTIPARYDEGICAVSTFGESCTTHWVDKPTYEWYFSQTSWDVKPLCVFVSNLILSPIAPGLSP